jgi:hypothetical protein
VTEVKEPNVGLIRKREEFQKVTNQQKEKKGQNSSSIPSRVGKTIGVSSGKTIGVSSY